MRDMTNESKLARVAKYGNTVLFVFMLCGCAGLLTGSTVLILEGKYLPGMAVSMVCIALSSMGRYSEAWNTRVSK